MPPKPQERDALELFQAHFDQQLNPRHELVQPARKLTLSLEGSYGGLPLVVRIPASAVATENPWEVVAAFAYCTDSDRGLCIPKRLTWTVPVRAGGDASRITVR